MMTSLANDHKADAETAAVVDGVSELSDDDLEKVTGGVGIVVAAAERQPT